MMQKGKRLTIYVLGFLIGFHIALPAYITSSFLSTIVSETAVGAIFSIGSAISILGIILLPKILNRFGNFVSLLLFLLIELAAFSVLATADSAIMIITAQIVSLTCIALIGLPLDIFLERYTKENSTGSVRGSYLFFISSAWVISQIAVSLFIIDSQYRNIFAISAVSLLPVLFIVYKQFYKFRDHKYLGSNPLHALASVSKNKEVFKILIINFLLQFFYSWMVIYTPIYLHQYIGFQWKEIGIIFSIMLLPFVLLEYPLGRIADKYIGEKEILSVGFFIMALATISIAFIDAKSLILWASLLFMSRVGAAMVESMSETFFFKHVKDSDLGYISLFRTTKPWAYVIAPAIATIIFPIAGIQSLFFLLAFLMLYSLRFSLALQDTK